MRSLRETRAIVRQRILRISRIQHVKNLIFLCQAQGNFRFEIFTANCKIIYKCYKKNVLAEVSKNLTTRRERFYRSISKILAISLICSIVSKNFDDLTKLFQIYLTKFLDKYLNKTVLSMYILKPYLASSSVCNVDLTKEISFSNFSEL